MTCIDYDSGVYIVEPVKEYDITEEHREEYPNREI